MVSRETQHIGGHHGSHSRVYTWSGTVCIAVDTFNQGGRTGPGANNQQWFYPWLTDLPHSVFVMGVLIWWWASSDICATVKGWKSLQPLFSSWLVSPLRYQSYNVLLAGEKWGQIISNPHWICQDMKSLCHQHISTLRVHYSNLVSKVCKI